MTTSGTVLVVAEQSGGKLLPTARELFGAGRTLGGDLVALLVGLGADECAAEAAGLGAARLLVCDDPRLALPTVEAAAAAVAAAIEAAEARIVLLAGTALGHDVASSLSARLHAPALLDITRLALAGDELTAVRSVYGGKLLVEVRAATRPVFVTVRAGAYPAPEPRPATAPSPERLAVAFEEQVDRVEVLGVEESAAGPASLAKADVVVVGGRGLGGPEHFGLVEDLAEVLGGAVGATRAVTDAGWRPRHEQVGQTGTTVAPELYLGVGVSGAVQHMAGMRGARTVVAINRDPDAPLVKMADFAIVGDLFTIVPLLLERLRAAR